MQPSRPLVCTYLALATIACGSGGDDSPGGPDAAQPLDAEVPDAPSGPCDPVAQTGCGSGEKCAWVDLTLDLGMLDCVPDGDRELGQACSYGPAGPTTGFDDCVAGTACDGTCRPVCSLTADTCGATSDCVRDANFGDALVGVCQPRCAPLSQETVDGDPACDSANPANPARACYGYFNDEFLCRAVPPAVQAAPDNYSHGDAPLYQGVINGCAPGFGPFVSSDGDGFPYLCVAMCQPAPTSLEDPANANGLVGSGHTCADRGGTAADECRYFWYLEKDFAPSEPPLHPDGLGFCWNPDDLAVPRCTTIAAADQAGTGCAPYVP